MTTQTQTLSDFLLARIAEEEKYASTFELPPGPWHNARVLAECEAKRAIAEEHEGWEPGEGDYYKGKDRAWDQARQYLALPYADHADYREEWRP